MYGRFQAHPCGHPPSKSTNADDSRYLNLVYQHLRLLEFYEYLLIAGKQPTTRTAAARRIASGAGQPMGPKNRYCTREGHAYTDPRMDMLIPA